MGRYYGSFLTDGTDADEPTDYDAPHASTQTNRRNKRFKSSHEPFRDNHQLELQKEEVDGVFRFMNPTHATFIYHGADSVWDGQGSEEHVSNEQNQRPRSSSSSFSDVEHKWTTRNNRKGRHALVVHQSSEQDNSLHPNTGLESVLNGIRRMFTHFAFWDVSYLTAISFTLAVVILLTNAILSVLPYANSAISLPSAVTYIEGALTLTGCVFFLFSSFLTFVEAVNSKTQGCFGWKQEEVSYSDATGEGPERGSATRLVPDWSCVHRRSNYTSLFSSSDEAKDNVEVDDSSTTDLCGSGKSDKSEATWRFFPSRNELREHCVYDLGFVTSSVLLCSSAIYCSAALASFITILTSGQIEKWGRIPQIIAGIGFAISSILFMLETQTKWLIPEIKAIGWQISFWNFLGSIGFTLCAVFAFANAQIQDTWSEHQMAYSYLWGSSGFLLGSLLQWYESLDKHPVEYKERE